MYRLANRFDRDWSRLSGGSPLFADFERWFRDMDRAFEPQVDPALPRLTSSKTEDGYAVTVDVPGLKEDDITLDVHNQVLTLSAAKVSEAPEGYNATRRERPTVRFTQSLRLPEDVDSEKVHASMKDGVLTVNLGKREEVKPRQIKVESA